MRQGVVLALCTSQLMHGQLRACLRIDFILGYPAAQYKRPELP